jgi:hypothetical protein
VYDYICHDSPSSPYSWNRPCSVSQVVKDNYDLRGDILSPEEWKGVNEVIKVLQPLLHFTKLAERRDIGLQD